MFKNRFIMIWLMAIFSNQIFFLAAEPFRFNGLNTGITVGANPDYYNANQSVWVQGEPFGNFNEKYLSRSLSFDGSSRIDGGNFGASLFYGFQDYLFLRLELDYSRAIFGKDIQAKLAMTDLGTGKAKISVSGWAVIIPLSVGIGNQTGKFRLFAGLGPALLSGKMTRSFEAEANFLKISAIADTKESTEYLMNTANDPALSDAYVKKAASLGNDSNSSATYASGLILGFHWIIGMEYEIWPNLSLGINVLMVYGSKIVSNSVGAGNENQVDSDSRWAGFISNKQGIYTSYTDANGYNQLRTDKLIQTIDFKNTRINLSLNYHL